MIAVHNRTLAAPAAPAKGRPKVTNLVAGIMCTFHVTGIGP